MALIPITAINSLSTASSDGFCSGPMLHLLHVDLDMLWLVSVPYLVSPSIEVFDVRWGCDGNDISDNSDNTRLAQVRWR